MSEPASTLEHMFELDPAAGAEDPCAPGAAGRPGPINPTQDSPPPNTFTPATSNPDTTTPTIASLSALLTVAPESLSPEDAVRFLQQLERHLGWLHGLQAVALVAAAGPEPEITEAEYAEAARNGTDPGIDDIAREEIASATGWGSGHARHRIQVARMLTEFLPQTMSALITGRISHAHASVIADAAEHLPGFGDANERELLAAACALLEERTMPTALTSSVTRTRRKAARAAAGIAELDATHRKKAQRLAHQVNITDDPDGMSTLIARMPSHHAHACMAAIRHLANNPLLDLPCDATVGQRRALAMATLIIGPRPPHPDRGMNEPRATKSRSTKFSSKHPSSNAPSTNQSSTNEPSNLLPTWPDGLPIAPSPKVHLDVVITLDALLGLSDQHAAIPGAGHLPAEVARGLLADATMRRMITDPVTGHLLDLGRKTYRIPEAVRRFIEARDQTCRFPGCNRRAIHCEIDHAVPWNQGGTTSPSNLGALCTRHHRMKTHAGWSIQDSDLSGACIWVSPHGRTYAHVPAPPLEPGFPGRGTSRRAPGPTTRRTVREGSHETTTTRDPPGPSSSPERAESSLEGPCPF
ncbi:MAG: DUF222 domain-containing protein [Actinomycetales bacterium]